MFTGIVTDVGRVRAVLPPEAGAAGDTRLEILTAYDLTPVPMGASIACSGVCLTVIDKGREDKEQWFAVNVSAETLAVSTLSGWQPGTRVNLERPLRVGEEFGGHIVQGHVDGVGRIAEIAPEGGSHRMRFEMPPALAPFIAAKGSIAVDGVSLTVNTADDTTFSVNIIPHTWAETAFSAAQEGHGVNLEIDVLARYVARLKEMS